MTANDPRTRTPAPNVTGAAPASAQTAAPQRPLGILDPTLSQLTRALYEREAVIGQMTAQVATLTAERDALIEELAPYRKDAAAAEVKAAQPVPNEPPDAPVDVDPGLRTNGAAHK